MTTNRISINFSKDNFTDTALAVKGAHVIEKMTNNASFPNPEPSLEKVQLAIDKYHKSLEQTIDGSKMNTVYKNRMRKELENRLRQLAEYVQFVSGGNEIKLLSSGFTLHRRREPVGPLDKAPNLIIKPGNNAGTVMLSCQAVPRARFYEFEYRELLPGSSNPWIKQVSTRRKILIEGLTSGKRYTFRVAGAASNPFRVWSNELSSYVL